MSIAVPVLIAALLAVVFLGLAARAVSRREAGRGTGVFNNVALTSRRAAALAHPRVDALSPHTGAHVAVPSGVVDPRQDGVARREFLNRSVLSLLSIGFATFAAATVAFLWQEKSGDFGSKLNVGKLADIRTAIVLGDGFHYVPAGKMWVTEYPSSALPEARGFYRFYSQVAPGLEAGLTALYQKCPHLGCRVPACPSSQWFECPCHGSKYNRVGEKKAGPTPRGLDRFPMTVNAADELIVDTGSIIVGPAIGTNTTGQEAEGPSCVGSEAGLG